MYSKRRAGVLALLFVFGFSKLGAVSYEEAYELEKEAPIFAIPLYEEVVKTAPVADVRKTASSRLYFLYEKFNKYVPALQYQIRAGTLKNKKGEWSPLVKNLADGLGVSAFSLLGILNACSKETSAWIPPEPTINPDTGELVQPVPPEPYRILSKKENFPLIRFCYSLKMKNRDYEGWDHIFFYLFEKELLAKDGALPLWVGSSIQSGKGTPYRRIFLSGRFKDLSNDSKSDILFLYAKFLRHKGKFESSTRYFLMSGNYSSAKRAKWETAKNLLLMDRKKEACTYIGDSFYSGDESEILMKKICQSGSGDWLSDYLPSIKILMRENPDPVFAYALEGGGRDAQEFFTKQVGLKSSDKDDDAEEDSESAEILAKLVPTESRLKFPFWDARDKEADLIVPDRAKYLCKVIRRPFFGTPSIQPQFCKEVSPGSLETLLSIVGEEEEETSFAFADPAYLPLSVKWQWKDISNLETNSDGTPSKPSKGPYSEAGPWSLEYIVYRKVLNRAYAEIRLGKDQYYVVSVKPSYVIWNKN
ncbi:hypothetical protein EHO59_00695 [Leptospira semungkisensis]|uniref:Uncharacterized protein n=1 Tax=Leptospira semungkisensis TaxID=2484985 RepID=A0A4R9G5N3_9LEPT|nr:hypothetical protein [Leptospira semungkisensis]TGK06691.1 hypothetical protein EHO59_00695 [Leptospira semungkisensis]